MRTEQEMLGLIIQVALEDERIRAAYLEGSRANPKIPGDILLVCLRKAGYHGRYR